MHLEDDGQRLWRRLAPLFAEDDGGLHDIRISNLSRESVVAVAGQLQGISVVSGLSAWDRSANSPAEVHDLLEAAEGVVAERFDPVHALLSEVQIANVTLPDLGVFIDADQVTLDYRSGETWSPRTLAALFVLLQQLVGSAPGSTLALHDGVLPKWQSEFASAFRWFCFDRAPG